MKPPVILGPDGNPIDSKIAETPATDPVLSKSQLRKLAFRKVGRTRPGMAQPHNRQRKAAEHRARKKREHHKKVLEFQKQRKPKLIDPRKAMIMPTYIIRRIYRANKVSIHYKQDRLPYGLFYEIMAERGRKRAVRKQMERQSRRANRAA